MMSTTDLSQLKRRKALIIVAAVLLSIGLLVTALWIQKATASYNKALPAYQQRVQEAFDRLDQQPPNTDAYRAYLEEHAKALHEVAATAPQQPDFLGVAVGSDVVRHDIGNLTHAVTRLQKAMQQYQAFLTYRDSLLAVLQDNAGKISTPDDMRALKKKLEANNKKLESLNPPTGLEAHLQDKISIYKDIMADLQGALEAYDTGNAQIYNTHISKLEVDVRRIDTRSVASELLDNHTYYEDFSQASKALERLL